MRLRITFSKTGPLIFIGNRDLLTIWERAARRVGLPLSYSHGFHPQPKLHLAAPLPLGFSSRAEVLDMRLDEDVDLADLPPRLQAALPAGITVLKIEPADPQAPALQAEVRATEYELLLPAGAAPPDLAQRVRELLTAAALPRERGGKAYDLRPLIEELQLVPGGDSSALKIWMRLASREGATGRPDEVLAALGIPRTEARIERTALIFREQSLQ